jgi:hypothetical protein
MKKTFLLLLLANALGFSQTKSSGTIKLDCNSSPISANFTLDKANSKVTLVLKGPSDRWFGIGIGVVFGNKMVKGDVLVYSTTLTDRSMNGLKNPPVDANTAQGWTTVSDIPVGGVRTLTLTRSLENSDTAGNDFQMPYDTTTSFSVVGVAPVSDTNVVGGHDRNATYAMATFSPLGVEDFSLNASSIFPIPSKGSFTVQSKTGINTINVYTQSGVFVKTLNFSPSNNKEVFVNELSEGVYLIELKNENDKSWKKVIVN